MAGTKALNVRMNFQIDTTQARQQIQQLGAQLNSITKASNFSANSSLGITQEILQATKAAAQLKTAIAEAVNPLTGNLNLTAFNDQLRASGMSLMDYRNQLSALGTVGNQTFNTLARSIATAETPLLRTGKAAQQMWTVLGNTVRWQATSSMIHGIMSTASQAMNYVKSLDSSLNSIRIVTGQNQAQMERFAQTANKAAKELNTSTNAYAKASLIYYQQGLSNAEVEKRVATTVKLANVSGQTAAKVSDQLTAIWNNFYDGSKSLEYYADVMTALGASTASSTDEIAKGLEKFSSIAKTTGLSYEYATSALSTVVAATRQSADSVGTSFKTLFSRLQGLSLGETLDDGTTLNKYSKALNVIGVNIKNANGSLKDMDNILDEIGSKWTSLSKAEQVALAQTVGGARNYTGLVSLMDNWDDFQTNLKTAQQAQGTLQNQADIYAQSWEAASNHVRVASETIYKNLLDDKFFKGLTNGFGSVLDMVGSLTNSLGGFKGTMLTLGNAAFQIFKPQLTQGFANIGLNARGIIRGQQDIIDIRTQARNALMAPVNFSRYNEVNQIQQQMNQNLNARQVLYESMQQKGKIPSYLQPAYQTMFNAINAQSDEAIASAERVFGMDEQQRIAQIRTQQNLNYRAIQYNRQLKSGVQSQEAKDYLALQKAAKSGNPIIAMQAQQILDRTPIPSGLQAYQTHTGAYMNGGLAGITGKAFTNYAEQYRATGVAANLQGLSRGNLSTMTQDDSKRMASYITQMVSGSKALGISFSNTIPELETINSEIQKYYQELSKGTITQEEYNQKVHTAITQNATLGSTIDKFIGPQATQLAKIEGDMLTEAYKAAGITDTESTEAKEIRTNLRNVLNSSEMTEAARLESIRKLGVSDESAKAMLKSLEDQNATKNVMNYSAAVATSMNALAAAGQVITSTTNLIKTFGDENATAGQQVSAFTASAMSIGMAIKPWNDFKEHAGDTLKLFGAETSMTLGKFGGILAGLAVGAIALSAGIKEYQKTTDTGLIKNYNTQIATATQLTSDAKTKYEELLTTKDTHNNLLNNLQELQQGTSQFTNALINANDAAYQLIDNYDLLYGKDYHFDTNGAINFEAASLEVAEKQALEDYQNRQIGEQGLKYSKRLIELNKLKENELLLPEYDTYKTIAQSNGKIAENMITAADFVNIYGQLMSGSEHKNFDTFLAEVRGQSGYTYNIDQLLDVFGVQDTNELNNTLKALSALDENTEAGLINKIFADTESKYYSEMQSIMQGMAELSASSLSDTYKNTDLAAYAASQALSISQGVELARFAGQATQKTWLEHLGIGTTPKEWYEQLFEGKSAEGLSDDEISTLVGEELIRLAYTDQDELMRRTGKTNLSDFGLTEFKGVKHYAELMQSYNLPNLENLTYQGINDSFNRLLKYDESGNNALNTAENKTIQEYRKYAEDVYNNQLSDLSTAMLRGIGDGLLNGATETEKGSKFEELVIGLAGQITDNNKEVMSSLTYGALKQATNAMINANEVGGETAKTMYSLLLRGRTQTGGFDAATQAILQNYNFDNSLASIYSNNNLKRYAQNQAQRDKYIELFSSQIEDIGKEKGWFQMLYNSSGFSDVLDKINSQFQATGQITAQYITDLAGKSEELSQFLKVSSDNAGLLNVNAGGLATIFEEINRGTSGITASNISSEFVSAVSKAESRSAANASAFEVVDNLDLGRSGLDFLDFFQDMGKEMYQANKAGWGFYSDPIQNIIDKIGGSKVRQVYMEANSHADWNFQQMWNYMKTNPDSAGFMTFMESMAGKKGKGGGGPADVMKYLYDTLGISGLNAEQQTDIWNRLGFRVDEKGNFFLREKSDGSKDFTQEQLVDNLTKELQSVYGWTEEDARNYAQVIMSTASTSGQVGQALDQRGAEAGFKDLFKGPISQEEYDTYYRRYGALMGYKTQADFEKDFKQNGGQIGLNLKKEEWTGMTTQDLVKRAQEQGISIMGEEGARQTIGNFYDLADAYGALGAGGTIDYNKLVTMIETMGGTEEDLIKMLEQDKDTVNKLVAQSASGEDIGIKEGETVRDYVNRIHESQGDTTFAYSGLSAEAANMAYMYEHMIMSKNEDGTWSWHYETQEERDRKTVEKAAAEKEAQRIATRDKKLDLYKNYGLSMRDINSRLENGETLDDILATEAAREQEEERQRIEAQKEADRKAERQQQEAARNIELTNKIKALGLSQEDIDWYLEKGGNLRDLLKREQDNAIARAAEQEAKEKEEYNRQLSEYREQGYSDEEAKRLLNGEDKETIDADRAKREAKETADFNAKVQGWKAYGYNDEEATILANGGNKEDVDQQRVERESGEKAIVAKQEATIKSNQESINTLTAAGWSKDRINQSLEAGMTYAQMIEQAEKEEKAYNDELAAKNNEDALKSLAEDYNYTEEQLANVTDPVAELAKAAMESGEAARAGQEPKKENLLTKAWDTVGEFLFGNAPSASGEGLEGAGSDVIVTNPELNTDKNVIPASKYHGTILLSDTGDYEAAKAFYDQIDDQGAFQSFRDNVWGNQGSDLYFQHEMNTEQQEELDRLQAEADNARYVLEHYDDELMAGETGLGITKGESLGITKEEAAQEAANRQEAADFYKYQNGMSPAERLAAITDAQTLLHTEGADKLTPFQKFLMNSIGEIVDYQGIMADATEDENGPNGKKKNAQVDEETGELVDEEGNPIDMPQGQQQPSGTGSGRDSGGDTGDWWRPGGGNDKNKYTPFGNGIWGDSNGNYVIDNGDGTYSPFTPPNESNIVSPDSGGGYDPHQSAVACFAAGTQVLMANGNTKNIEDVLIDEIVISYDELQQKFVCNKVIKFDKHIDTIDLVQITFDDGEILKLTPSHPLYSTKGWKSLDIKKAFLAHGVVTTLLNIGDTILGINKSASVINIEKITDQQFYTTYNIDIENSHTYLVNGFIAHNKAASGQNNARLLAYASGKEGHIAVTGELGPELRVKSDGSMDILGKTGREYAWIEPDDRIYTASQSAGILKSNKIPGLEGLAKGINNYIPGYEIGADWNNSGSSGGGGGGGGGRGGGGGAAAEKDPRYDPNTLKIRDVLERYYTILQQIDNITKAVERFSKVADRAWGRERIRAIEKQNEMQQKQYEAQKKYIAEIEDYLTTDQSALTTMIQEFVTGYNEGKEAADQISWAGAEFDENGVLTNYRDFVEKLVEQYNANAEANSRDKEAQYKFQEQLKDIQMYTDTLNLYEEQKDALEDIKNAILDTAIKAISYEVEYKLELSGDADRILNFQADKYKDDVYQAAKYLELLDQRADLTRQNLIAVQDGIFKTLGTYAGEAMRTGAMHDLEELGIYGTDQFKLDEELTDADEDETEEARIDRLKGISTKVNEWLEQLREKNADAAAEIDKMIEHSEEEGQEDIITNYEEVIRRLNQQIDYTMVRAKVDEWLEELRSKNAEAAAEIDKIVQRNADGEIINYTDVIERLNEENVRLSDEAIALLMEDQDAFFNWMSDFKDNPGWVDFTTEHKDLLTNYMDQIYQYLESLQDTYEQTIEQLGDSIKATSKQMDAAIDEFDYYGDVYKTFGNIIDLTNRHMTDVTQDFFNTLNSKSMDNNINKIKATATNYHLLQNELAEVTKQYNEMQARANAATGEEQIYLQQSADKLKEQLDIANSQYEDAHKAFLSSWEDALSKMAENYKAAVEEASRNFEQGFSPLFNTLALLQAQFDREKTLGDLYVDNYQRIHDLNKLNRDIQLSIDDTDNLKGKERLRDLQAEINQLQEDGTELSEYDLDILDKKYKLELARQALEDAKDAKSMVRLARDNNGNWSYVYTANQDDVDKAEQDYEDAIREMEQANEDYIDNIQDQILQVQQEAQQAILALQPEDFATYEDYLAAVNNIQNSMYQTLDFLRSQLNNAFGNNEWLDPYIVDRYGINNHDLTTDFGDTTLAGLLDNPDVDKAIKKAKENFEDNLKKPVLDAFIEYSERQDEVYNAAEHDIATIGEDFQNEMESIADSSEYQVEVVENLSQRVQNAFNDMAAVVDEKTKKHLEEVDDLVNKYEKLVEALTEVKRLSGENLPADMMQAIDTVDTWREIEDLENKLKENGHIRLLEDLVDIDREDVIYRSDKLADATEQIDKWLESLGDSAKDIAEAIERNDAGQITNYKDIVQKLSNIEKNDDNKTTLKEIKKWKEKDDKAVLMDENQSLTKEGLWTYLMAGDEYTKQFLKDKIDNAAKNSAIDVGADVDETEKTKVENYLKAHGIVYVKWDNGLEKFESMDDWLVWYEKHKHVESSGGGWDRPTPWTAGGWTESQLSTFSGGYIDTGGYTGRWQSADTGMYTGEWPGGSIRRNGRLAWLHQKELILNAHDTENFLDAMEIVRQLDNLTNWMANGLGDLIIPRVTAESGELEQNVHIEAEFPNVTDHNEIEQAFNNLVNMASQYANRK